MPASGEVDLGPASGSAYGNPQPYPSPALERSMLIGRLKVAQTNARTQKRQDTRAHWSSIVDELLGHLVYYRDRAISAAIDEAERSSC